MPPGAVASRAAAVNAMRLLIVEDEADLAASLGRSLAEEGFAVDVVHDGAEALVRLDGEAYDAVLLDLMLPAADGWHVVERVRSGASRVPIVVITARDASRDKVQLLNLGADDYVTKPFAFEELLARVRAVIRRAAGHPAPVAALGDVRLDFAARRVTRGGVEVDLAPKEYALLEYLALHRGTLVTRSRLYEHLYDHTEDTMSNVLDVYVASLRRKLGPDIVRTRRGQGFIVEP